MLHYGETLALYTDNMCIQDFGASCHITNNNTGLFEVTKIHKSIQSSSGNMTATKKGKLCVNICQVDDTEWIHTLWLVKYCPKAGANLFSLTCELSQGNKTSNDHHNSIVVESSDGNFV